MIKKLYDLLQPNHYKLHLNIDSKNSEFNGKVSINAQLTSAATTLELHGKDLEITAASINGVETSEFKISKDVLTITSQKQFEAGTVEIELEFKGKITDAMHGMYPCYFTHEGKTKKLIATQFESHHAREVFPCIDEPAAKATFDLSLVTNEGEVVLANTPVKKQYSQQQRTTTEFETTPKMSTYLLAFVTGEMVSKEAKTKDGVLVRSWASATQDPAWLDFSVQEAVNYIEFYNDYFDIPYPLEKCDQVALPDFESGAMENWGLITYRETALLSDPLNESLSTKQLIAIVVAHELSHQWFGNLVTMQWWDDLWLNESFASMMEYIAVDAIHPEWNMWEEYISHDGVVSTNRDVYRDVQSVRVAVSVPDEIHTLFDPAIVYAKGGKLLKSLHDMLGSETWRRGLHDYFKKHEHGNTTSDDLWNALSNHSNFDINQLMNTWIEQPGQPLITVDQNGNTATLSQQRLLLDSKPDETLWRIPLLAENTTALLSTREETITLADDSFIQLNNTGVGHYVVNYVNAKHKKWLAQQIADPKQRSTWKIARLNELIMLARHGDTHLDEALETIVAEEDEARAMVWSQIANVLGSTNQIIENNQEAERQLRVLTFQLVQKQHKRLGWKYSEGESSNSTHLRTIILGLALSSEESSIITNALKLYRAAEVPEILPAEIRSLLMVAAVKFGTDEEFEALISEYKSTTNADYRNDICAALSATKSTQKAKKLTQLLLDTKVVRTQDTIRWYAYLLKNKHTRSSAWEWLTSNWNWVLENFGGSKSYDDFARYSGSFLNSDEWLKEYEAFFAPKKHDPALRRAILIGISEIKAKSDWNKRDAKSVVDWLSRFSAKS